MPSARTGSLAADERCSVIRDRVAGVGGTPLRAPAASAKLGTGHGAREYSYVTHTEFARAQSEPNEVIRIRYDDGDEETTSIRLVRLEETE